MKYEGEERRIYKSGNSVSKTWLIAALWAVVIILGGTVFNSLNAGMIELKSSDSMQSRQIATLEEGVRNIMMSQNKMEAKLDKVLDRIPR